MPRPIAAILATVTVLAVPASAGALRQEIENAAAFARLFGAVRYFYPSDAAAGLDWNRFAVHGLKQLRAIPDARRLEAALEELFEPLGPGIDITSQLPPSPPVGDADERLIAWRYLGAGITTGRSPYGANRTSRPSPTARSGAHVDVDLGSGLKARMAVALSQAQASASAERGKTLKALKAALERIPDSSDPSDLDVRLADVVVVWNVFRHFYPYWAETGADWDARLRPHLELAYTSTTRDAHRDALRRLVADARDGHGRVNDVRSEASSARWLPVQFGVIGSDVVITASALSAEAPVGAVVSAIDGRPAASRVSALMELTSGTAQWKQARALREIAACSRGVAVNVVLDSGTGPRTARFTCEVGKLQPEKRPDAVVELTAGVWYLDLTRAQMSEVTSVLTRLASARGVVFDVRGYPTDAGAGILPHLIDAPESDRWMHVAKITGPFGQVEGWESFGWNLQPARPRVGGRIVFLTDGRAISYAESVMGYVADRKLGTIVGGTTAGTNGNVANFVVPGGFTISFTGMRVTGHDGRAPFHLVGVKPDIPVAPTLAGLRKGLDEVLDRALLLIRQSGNRQ